MKVNFLKKFLVFFGLAFGVVALGSCQNVDQTARVDLSQSSAQVMIVEGTPITKKGRCTLAIINDTIYATKTFTIAFNTYDTLEATIPTEQKCITFDLCVRNGQSGYLYNEWDMGTSSTVKIEIVAQNTQGKTECSSYYNVWDTYLGWWIVAIVVVAIAWIAFACTVFSRGVTADVAKEEFRKHVATITCCSMFALILCIFPLIFGAWIPTMILLGMVVAIILGQLGMVGIKTLASKGKTQVEE